MIRDRRLYLHNIPDMVETALDFVQGLPLDEFTSYGAAFYARVHCLEIIGEACKRIPDE